jgi:hypothetical protein
MPCQGLVSIFRKELISLNVSVRKRIPMPIRKRPLTMLITLIYRFILSKAERNELKAREERKNGIPKPIE